MRLIDEKDTLPKIDEAFLKFAEHDDVLRLYSDARLAVINAPTIDPESLRQKGEWIRTDDPEFRLGDFECSACEYLECDVDTAILEPGVNCLYFCPNCGADMRKEVASNIMMQLQEVAHDR